MDRVYTDGCCLGNPGAGGFAVVFPDGGEFSKGYVKTTNNRMEIMAVLHAIENTEGKVEVMTDSQYVSNAIGKWLDGWRKNGWRTSQGAVKNRDLWERYLKVKRNGVRVVWVKGHDGNPGNERADALAKAAAALPADQKEYDNY